MGRISKLPGDAKTGRMSIDINKIIGEPVETVPSISTYDDSGKPYTIAILQSSNKGSTWENEFAIRVFLFKRQIVSTGTPSHLGFSEQWVHSGTLTLLEPEFKINPQRFPEPDHKGLVTPEDQLGFQDYLLNNDKCKNMMSDLSVTSHLVLRNMFAAIKQAHIENRLVSPRDIINAEILTALQ